jgi:hypothetical protein
MNDEHAILQQMLDACSSVTTSALSCPTLGSATLRQALATGATSSSTEGGVGASDEIGSNACSGLGSNCVSVDGTASAPSTVSANEAAEYADEVEIAKWLDSQIADYQVALARLEEEDLLLAASSGASNAPTSTAATTSAGNAASGSAGQKRKRTDTGSAVDATRRQKERELKRLKEDIFDETVRVQQERLLISRMRMSAAAIYTTFPDAAPRPCDDKPSIGSKMDDDVIDSDAKIEATEMVPNGQEEIHAAHLRREGLRSRDGLVASGLQKIEDIQQLRSRLEAVNADCREWQQKNRDLWNQLTSGGHGGTSQRDIASNCGIGEAGSSDEFHDSIRRENNILKHALAEAIASSGIDWFGDERLSNTFATLED